MLLYFVNLILLWHLILSPGGSDTDLLMFTRGIIFLVLPKNHNANWYQDIHAETSLTHRNASSQIQRRTSKLSMVILECNEIVLLACIEGESQDHVLFSPWSEIPWGPTPYRDTLKVGSVFAGSQEGKDGLGGQCLPF